MTRETDDKAARAPQTPPPEEDPTPVTLPRVGLKTALVALLAAALLPAGGFAIGQAISNLRSSDALRQEADLARLSQYTDEVDRLLVRAQTVLGYAVGDIQGVARTPTLCNAEMRRIMAQNPHFLGAFLINADGMVICGGSDDFEPVDVSERETYRLMRAEPRPQTTVAFGKVTRQPVLVVSHPLPSVERFGGFASISISLAALDGIAKQSGDDRTGRFAVFDAKAAHGAPIASDMNDKALSSDFAWLPWAVDLETLIAEAPAVRDLETRDGAEATFASLPMADKGLVGVAGWKSRPSMADGRWRTAFAVALPIITWLLATGVVYFAVDRLVIANMRRLTRLSASLRNGDLTARAEFGDGAPVEFAELGAQFNDMAERLEQRDARLRRAVIEERMLLREVYHRVKNNLQLIVSLLNLQSRKVVTEEGRRVIRHTQDRVQSLALVHQNLYQAGQLSEARLDRVIEQMVSATSHLREGDARVRVTMALEPVQLDADRAVPAAMLSTEALMNAAKHGFPPGVQGFLELSLVNRADGGFRLVIANSIPDAGDGDGASSRERSIGSRLMQGFARQLRADLTQERKGDRYIVTLDVPPDETDETDEAEDADEDVLRADEAVSG